MLILMTCLWIRSKAVLFSNIAACGFGLIGPCITYDASVQGVQGYRQNRIGGQAALDRQAGKW